MSNAILTSAGQIRSNVLFLVYQHKNEMKREIEEEFAEVLKNNVINPYAEDIILYGKTFAFRFAGVKRFKYIIRLKFDVFRRHEIEHKHEKYDHSIGKVFVTVRVRE